MRMETEECARKEQDMISGERRKNWFTWFECVRVYALFQLGVSFIVEMEAGMW